MLKKMKKYIKINGKYWSVEKSIIIDLLIQLTKHWWNIVFLCIIYCVTNAVAVMYKCSRNILMAEKRIVFSKQKSENM